MKIRAFHPSIAAALASTLALAAQTAPSKTAAHPPAHRTAAAAGVTPLPKGIPPVKAPMKVQYVMRYQEIAIGKGDLAKPGDSYKVQYTGWLATTGEKFDSSYDRGTPIDFIQGSKRVITGWDQGFEGMHVGGKRRLFIPYQLAYGDKGRGPIPPQTNLIFDVELLDQHDPNVPGLEIHPALPPQPQQQPDRAEPKPQSPQ
ncbi:FKBP-type peptidyl-prolyl cis-trans isomerase [Silvibacterium acidisoli]|uniref:FKBP-type peptidyl-prolyl cis-trans isomerase n=1 Tax=Acidobacteriaceae bacterium ZG23-2 TaxID=2883246 RepID=UPI00406C9DA5